MADIKLSNSPNKYTPFINTPNECINDPEFIEFLKKRCDVLEKDLFKSQTQIKKLEGSLKKAQELITKNSVSINNTSISFFLPSEFKLNWENMLKDQLMESFENIYDDHIWLSHVVQDTFAITYNRTNVLIQNKIRLVLEVLNLKDITSENFLNRFRSLFQDYFQSIFLFTDDFFLEVKNEVLICTDKYNDCGRLRDIKQDINSNYFKILINCLFRLCIYMLLHDPLIKLNIKEYDQRKIEYYYFNKNTFLTVEGFGKDKTPCSLILSPPLFRNNFIFQGIKPAVYCLSNVSEEVIKECEEKDQNRISNREKALYEDKVNISNNFKENANKSHKTSIIASENNSFTMEGEHVGTIENNIQKKTDCFDHPLKRDSNNLNKVQDPNTLNINHPCSEMKNQTFQNCQIEKEFSIIDSNKKRTNYRSNSEFVKNENSINIGEHDINLNNNSYLSTDNNKGEKHNNSKTLDKLMFTSNFDNNNLYENSNDIANLIKKKNCNLANDFLDTFNKTSNINFKQSLQNKLKHNTTNSSGLKMNQKMQKNNFFQTNREISGYQNKQMMLSQDFQKRKSILINNALVDPNKVFEKNRQTTIHSPEMTSSNSNNYSKLTSFIVAKDPAKENFFTRGSEKNNSPKILNNFMKMKSVMTMKNSIKNAYIEYMNSKALSKNANMNMNKKVNLNSSNPNSNNNNNNPIYNIKSNLNRNSLNLNIPQTNNNRNDKNILTKNLTDKTNSRPDNNNLNDNEYVQLNSENIVDCSNRNLYEFQGKSHIENSTFHENLRSSDLRFSSKLKREKDVFFSTNHNNSKRDNLKDNNNISSNNSINENYMKKDKFKLSPKSDIKPNLFKSKDHHSSGHKEGKSKLFEPSKTSKQMVFKNLQKNLKNSNKL